MAYIGRLKDSETDIQRISLDIFELESEYDIARIILAGASLLGMSRSECFKISSEIEVASKNCNHICVTLMLH